MKKKIEKRLCYLYSGETASIICFLIVFYFFNLTYPQFQLSILSSFIVSFFLLLFILGQGSVYWFIKWRRLKQMGTADIPNKLLLYLKITKKVNLFTLMFIPVLFVIDYQVRSLDVSLIGLLISIFVYLFAVLEYINYFHVQLSYDNKSDLLWLLRTKKLKRACLSKEFERINLK